MFYPSLINFLAGIEQFWTDDYKVFEQVYGKTSDRDIYGETLPPTLTFGKEQKKEASQKSVRYLLSPDTDYKELDQYNFPDRYNDLLTKHTLKHFNKKKPASSAINFVSYTDFKPISQSNDPETYDYLKHLEELNKEEKYGLPESVGGFKPYLNYLGPNPEESDAYKSIQDILDAHEANKESYNKNEDEDVKYLNYGKNKHKKPPRVHNEVSKPRCVSGRCRKRSPSSYRSRRRPYVGGLKAVVVI